ncbi:EamA-like transporter family protein [Luteitalea pratensis]|uniref:EamA-like transporter family protein n=1 Tax=Luteitalea pratensis TaxID=1855912 RepID=A0A143PIC9_LUTPR|nr:EamA family transporter [Luteitalea pratensis]AMY08295.1 EamA-like transporter family protein [Luteitalea pratensis]
MTWLVYASISALAAAATAILAKIGLEGVPSTLATAIRTVVVLICAWGVVFAVGQQHAMASLSRRSLLFLTLSGLGTGVSWLAYFHALKLAPASSVAPIDKLSLPLTICLALVVLQEQVSMQAWLGVALMVIGALLTLR